MDCVQTLRQLIKSEVKHLDLESVVDKSVLQVSDAFEYDPRCLAVFVHGEITSKLFPEGYLTAHDVWFSWWASLDTKMSLLLGRKVQFETVTATVAVLVEA